MIVDVPIFKDVVRVANALRSSVVCTHSLEFLYRAMTSSGVEKAGDLINQDEQASANGRPLSLRVRWKNGSVALPVGPYMAIRQ